MGDEETTAGFHIGAARSRAESLRSQYNGREIALVLTKLDEAALWLRCAEEIHADREALARGPLVEGGPR